MQDIFIILFQILILLFSLVIHEVAHGTTSLALGDDTAKRAGRLSLNPARHLDPVGSVLLPMMLGLISGGKFFFGWAKPVPINPYRFENKRLGTILVSAAGPFVNLLTAFIFGLLIKIFNPSGFIFFAFYYVVIINSVLAIFNLMPIFPLDGSKIFFPIFFENFEEIEYRLGQFSLILVFLFAFYGFQYIRPIIEFVIYFFTGTPLH
jgi:Zn-dependent protease